MTLTDLKNSWQDTEEFHKHIHELFCQLVDADPQLKSHRDYVQNNIWGFGERSFWWLWKLVLEEFPEEPKLLEIGCFKGATLSVWQLLNPQSIVTGVTPLDSTGIDWDGDYRQMIEDIHTDFGQFQPYIIKGLSENRDVILEADNYAPYNCVYVDGGHERRHIDNDLLHYAPMVKDGGFLVIDDACCDMHMPWGYFQGISDVTNGALAYMEQNGDDWEFYGNVVHLRIYKRK